MAAVEQMELDVLDSKTQLFGIKFRHGGRIILVLAARDVQDGGLHRPVIARFPVARECRRTAR